MGELVELVCVLTRLALYKDEAGVIQVRAYYDKGVPSEGIAVTFSMEVTDIIPNWGLAAKWDAIQEIIEQA